MSGTVDVLLDVLLGEHRLAGGDRAEQRQPFGRPMPRIAADGVADRAVEQLDRARLGRVAPQQADPLEVRQVRMHRRRRREPDRLPDVAHRRRIAVPRRVPADEVEDLLLALCQVHSTCSPFGWTALDDEHVFVD